MGYKYVITLTQGAFYQVNHPTLLIEMLQHSAFFDKAPEYVCVGCRHAASPWLLLTRVSRLKAVLPVQLGGQFLRLPFVCLFLFPSS